MSELVAGRPAGVWLQLFYLCHEWRWDGGRLAAKHSKNQVVRTGYYSRLEWPAPGGALAQCNLVVAAFMIIKDEESKMLAEKTA